MTPEAVLVHACCGPCATVIPGRLTGRRALLYCFNPNIHPRAEYDLRLDSLRRFAASAGLELIEGPWDPDAWRAAVAGFEGEPEGGARCRACYALRLAGTAEEARRRGIPLFSTTLTVSPHKRTAHIHAAGEAAAGGGADYLALDLKKRGGFEESVRRSAALGLHRQTRCGCLPGGGDGA